MDSCSHILLSELGLSFFYKGNITLLRKYFLSVHVHTSAPLSHNINTIWPAFVLSYFGANTHQAPPGIQGRTLAYKLSTL